MERFLKSVRYALEGIKTAWQQQPNLRIHFVVFCLVVVFGFLFDLSLAEWIAVFLVSGLVVVAELLNSAIEKVVDLASPQFHPLAKQAKDIAAGAVLLAAATSVLIGLLIYGKHFLQFLSDYL